MTMLGFSRTIVAAALMIASVSASSAADEKKPVASGKTQVVARAAGRELTLTDLRLEMSRLGLSPADPNAERIALESLMSRTLLAKAARDSSLHKKPEAIARMYAAQDQALADLYLAIASQPPEPTRDEIERYVRENPTLFAARKTYDFTILTLESKNFAEDALTPLFDKEADFSRLADLLAKAGAEYRLSTLTQSGAAFPAPIRLQLAKYGLRDNIVLRGENETQILKIAAVRDDPGPEASWGPLARRLLIEEAAAKRAETLMARLKKDGAVAYYRASAAPIPAAKPAPKAQ
jgi:EpsD family peptidyl-prolyl cis-trans isomerase